MDAANAVSNDNVDTRPPAVLRGTAKGLEIHVHGSAGADAIVAAVTARLDEAPTFFRGSDVRIRVEDGPLPAGCLGRLDALAVKFELRIVEVGAPKRDKPVQLVDGQDLRPAVEADAVPRPNLAAGSAPAPSLADVDPPEAFDEAPTLLAASLLAAQAVAQAQADAPADEPLAIEPVMLADSELTELVDALTTEAAVSFDEPTQTAVPIALAASAESELAVTTGTRLVVGPVRSGVILEHHGHLIVFGDVNPGAEIRAQGNIVVLGRLRGTAHAGIGQDVGFILALRLEPQQLRIGRKVARAADSDTPASEAEIAYVHGRAASSSSAIRASCRATSPPASKRSTHGSSNRHHFRQGRGRQDDHHRQPRRRARAARALGRARRRRHRSAQPRRGDGPREPHRLSRGRRDPRQVHGRRRR